MGVGIKNISVFTGYSYIKYLQSQLQDIQKATDNQKGYNSFEILADERTAQKNQELYTRCEGTLAKEWGLEGSLTADKLTTIAKLELGKDDRTSPYVKTKPKTELTIKGADGIDVLLTKKDYANGFYLDKEDEQISFNKNDVVKKYCDVRKTAIETTYTLDSTFSYFYQTLNNDEDRSKFVKDFFDSAKIAREEVLEPLMKNYKGESGKTMTYSFMHKDNRDGLPFLHIHDETSNLIMLENGKIQAIEIPEIREKDFHSKMDCVFKSNFLEKFQQSFPNVKVEAYDQQNKSITKSSFEAVKDWRVAFDKSSLEAIRKNSTTTEKINGEIKKAQKYLQEEVNLKKTTVQDEFNLKLITQNQYFRRIENLTRYFEKQSIYIKSNKFQQNIQRKIKAEKKQEITPDKENRLTNIVSDMNLSFAKSADVGILYRQKSNDEILATITNTSPFFTRNSLIIETTKSFGKDGVSKADEIIKFLESKNDLISGGYANKATNQEKFTLKSLCDLEIQNVQLMKEFSQSNDRLTAKGIEQKIDFLEGKKGLKLELEQRNLVKSVFDKKQASIVIGVPGAGKSLAISIASQIARHEGYQTIGIAPTAKVATALEQTEVDRAMTIDKLNLDIESGKTKLTNKHIVFLDEASMVGTRNWNTLLNNLNGAKLVVVGDVNQIQSVAVGNTLNEFMKEDSIKKNVNYLTQIRRQNNDEALSIVKLTSLQSEYRSGNYEDRKLSGQHIIEAIELMRKQGNIKNNFSSTAEKTDSIANAYLNDKNNLKNKLILASTNDSINSINEEIQTKRLNSKQLTGNPLTNGKFNFYAGDRVVMLKNEKNISNNGDFGTITSIKDGKAFIKLDDNKTISMKIEDGSKINLAYSTSIHKSQGMTLNRTFIFGENSIVNNSELFNVAVSRNRDTVEMYVTKLEENSVINSYKRPNKKESLIDIAKNHTATNEKEIEKVLVPTATTEVPKRGRYLTAYYEMKNEKPTEVISKTNKPVPAKIETRKANELENNPHNFTPEELKRQSDSEALSKKLSEILKNKPSITPTINNTRGI